MRHSPSIIREFANRTFRRRRTRLRRRLRRPRKLPLELEMKRRSAYREAAVVGLPVSCGRSSVPEETNEFKAALVVGMVARSLVGGTK